MQKIVTLVLAEHKRLAQAHFADGEWRVDYQDYLNFRNSVRTTSWFQVQCAEETLIMFKQGVPVDFGGMIPKVGTC